jgi:hypothetical protein
MVPMAQHTLSVNVAFLSYGPAGFLLSLYDQRPASVAKIGDTPVTSNFAKSAGISSRQLLYALSKRR